MSETLNAVNGPTAAASAEQTQGNGQLVLFGDMSVGINVGCLTLKEGDNGAMSVRLADRKTLKGISGKKNSELDEWIRTQSDALKIAMRDKFMRLVDSEDITGSSIRKTKGSKWVFTLAKVDESVSESKLCAKLGISLEQLNALRAAQAAATTVDVNAAVTPQS